MHAKHFLAGASVAPLVMALLGPFAACTVEDSTPSGDAGAGETGGKTGSGGSGGGAGVTSNTTTGSSGSAGSLGSAGNGGSGGSAAGAAGSGGSAGSAGSGGSAGNADPVDSGQPHVYTVTCSLPGVDAGASEGGVDGSSVDATDEAAGPTGPVIASFTLYDYETNLPFSGCKEMLKDFTVNITGDNVPLTVVANVAPGAGQQRVVWDYDGMLSFNTERRSPFALGGDAVENDLDPPSVPLAPGPHTVTITLYAEADPPADAGDGGLGTVLGRATIKITVVK